ncbi:hypothetical protein GDO81_022011 [Engystomops pustulosus]|uniref:G-protein coupled receptors family 1 profile domain-containing protein n=1 Tax=Engystomops pustulosus TaxID=76066 RepID=A0AAV6YYI2_ENGPU|nr:hypothetical protein GDO81_022011 [Engystomops pustulosus]
MEDLNETEVTEFIFMAFGKSTQHPVLLSVIFLFLYLIIICGNILMILTITYDSRLHTPMYYFVFALSCTDICYLTTIVPQTVCNLLGSTSSILYNNCATQMFFFSMIGEFQLAIITIMAYDRYAAISQPLHYTTVMSLETCFKFLGLGFAIACLFSFILVYAIFRLPFCHFPTIDHFYCDVGQTFVLTCHKHKSYPASEFMVYLIAFCIFIISFCLLISSYSYIINAVLKIHTTEGRQKAFSTCSSHLTIVLVEYGCLWFIYCRTPEAYYLDKNKKFVMAFTYITPIVNPMVYSVRNKAVLEGFKKLLAKKNI